MVMMIATPVQHRHHGSIVVEVEGTTRSRERSRYALITDPRIVLKRCDVHYRKSDIGQSYTTVSPLHVEYKTEYDFMWWTSEDVRDGSACANSQADKWLPGARCHVKVGALQVDNDPTARSFN